MEKRITIPIDLLEQIKASLGATGMTDSQLVSFCLDTGLSATKCNNLAFKEKYALLDGRNKEIVDQFIAVFLAQQ